MHILTFRQFFTEKFLRGYSSRQWVADGDSLSAAPGEIETFTEIYENPTQGEILTLNDHDPKKQIGCWLFGQKKTMYAWRRDAATHNQIRFELRQSTTDAWPFYLQYDLRQKLVTVTLGLWSMQQMGIHMMGNPKREEEMFRTHPVIQRLSKGGRFVFRDH